MKKHTTHRILALGASLLALTAIPLTLHAESRSSGTAQAGQWEYSPWYGWYDTTHYPHILHVEHGWQMLVYKTDNSLMVYDYGTRSYLYSAVELYPWIYKFGDNAGWYYYCQGGRPQERWFKLAHVAAYVSEGDINTLPLAPGVEHKVPRPRMIP